jgi:CDP-diacylglycerol--glycerol-3-phosphate 3-phosphatidyltransferase
MKLAELLTGRILTISNILSLSRVLLFPPLWYLLSMEKETGEGRYHFYIVIIMTFGILTDFLDGYLARLLNQVSRLGQFLDPVADKITALYTFSLLIYYKDYPAWVILVIVLRDLFAIVGGFIIFSNRDIQVRPNTSGKLMVCSLAASAYIYVLTPTFNIFGITLQHLSLVLFVIFTIISMFEYWKTYSNLYFSRSGPKD